MKKAIVSPENLRPSVETSLHNLINYTFVIHTHPTLVNGLMCSNHVKKELEERFGDKALYVEYTDPGFILFKKLQERIGAYRKKHGENTTDHLPPESRCVCGGRYHRRDQRALPVH